ncbi:NADH dehydrogenase subunit J [Limimonas halophila]|uniref:NADH-quinone oxidoreductase subunit J n=1 Tax=Limimonas halophila TaxID=1082479 RepID=A0A1G7N7I7_9PROT|nr:NADH-quinone oxidoreductase subunit J [Limimonas halophila]SDF69912.1 NADH dehydrogenase subunit J [Limimonas halophila]
MIIQAICFYLFAAIMLASAVMVISARNPVHSVLFLILAFFNAAALFILIGAEFLGMLLIVVYLGAVTVLFLFVVMMLDINIARMREGFLQYLPIGALIGLVLLAELLMVLGGWAFAPQAGAAAQVPIPPADEISNTAALGRVIYTKYIYLFQAAGLVLLVAMVGAIVLTLRRRPGVQRQRVYTQNMRPREQAVELKKVRSGSGV